MTGWVKNGNVYLQDRKAFDYVQPSIDASQDWTLISGQEVNGVTMLKVRRALDTCDDDDDSIITDGTIRVIWALNQNDPSAPETLMYHGATNRGRRSLHLLSYYVESTIPPDAGAFDVTMDNVQIESTDTTYACKYIKSPPLQTKHHLVRMEAIITPDNEGIVHHMLLYECPRFTNEEVNEVDGYTFNCGENAAEKMPCKQIVVGWVIGGEVYDFPSKVGYPIGEPNGANVYILEVHYDNPTLLRGKRDSSGMRLWLTSTLRQHDAGELEIGTEVTAFMQIPPHYDTPLTMPGYCFPACTQDTFPQDGINVFAVYLHAHLTAKAIRVLILRKDGTVELMAADENFDFNYQYNKFFNNEIKIMPGDGLMVECDYATKDRKEFTFGGLATTDEMCLAELSYYPKIPLSLCQSISDPDWYLEQLGADDFGGENEEQKYLDPIITGPQEIANKPMKDLFNEYFSEDYKSQVKRDAYQNFLRSAKIYNSCLKSDQTYLDRTSVFLDTFSYDMKLVIVCTVVVGVLLLDASSALQTSENFPQSALLDPEGRVTLYWSNYTHYLLHMFDSTHIVFEIHAETTGWVGFGISPTGGMKGSDIATGWVKNGNVYLQDRKARDYIQPSIDASQDWTLISGQEVNGVTMLKVRRALDTCDDDDDSIITDGTIRVIWALNQNDPSAPEDLAYHGATNRGRRSLHLLSYYVESTIPPDASSFDVTMDNVRIRNSDTTYRCKYIKTPSLSGKHHMIRMEAIITPGNEGIVHHMLLYECPRFTNREANEVDDITFNCGENSAEKMPCTQIVVGWAIGGEVYDFPSNVGYPIGEPNGANVYILEVHYDNPTLLRGKRDSSGMRLWLTSTLRQHDAGELEIGNEVTAFMQIPPHYDTPLTMPGYCFPACTEDAFPQDGINVFAVYLHAHLTAKAIRVLILRKDGTVELMAADENFDFNYQYNKFFDNEVKIMPGDGLMVECDYETKDRQDFTFGGLATTDEMCLVELSYYPKIPLALCLSSSDPDWYLEQLGANNFGGANEERKYLNPIITGPRALANQPMKSLFNEYYSEEYKKKGKRDEYQTFLRSAKMYNACLKSDYSEYSQTWIKITTPTYQLPSQPGRNCM
ncbi:PREDICTED: LOW QUALITY PROTEIN: DBH-like monooxygenase protein 1 [Priapulus caudatus]|uniref:LOW QUALITY PROTEIN: DBH-like monooxygenase protein 1 n=1 Tax=Priapulus caudatus TaxID=37621 RepID=A0ABM1DTI7_PRICU|nr:PREDICTED: LOW QUALITY PROTEIN: DBH-like monooxygenase protein 1 [Priapulus caudatus]